jgi:hypothetical protein
LCPYAQRPYDSDLLIAAIETHPSPGHAGAISNNFGLTDHRSRGRPPVSRRRACGQKYSRINLMASAIESSGDLVGLHDGVDHVQSGRFRREHPALPSLDRSVAARTQDLRFALDEPLPLAPVSYA